MSFSKAIAQEIEELGMVRWDLSQGANYFVEWSNDDRKVHILVTQHLEVFWEVVAANGKLWDGTATTPFQAINAINGCISDNALGETINIEREEA